ncbi:SDR family oxidoreductase [Streptomyces cyaneofuscatus]|uniref:SDR family oxidoreductase n=1 Tax=Streptomyces cyaneofuscatus TaxID=66883 RepID=UPI0033E997BC
MVADGTKTQVVVVGAGPVGLMLAGELRLGGADVVVLERRTAPTTASRATTLHARTMEILDSRGLLDRLGPVPNEVTGHFGGIPLDLSLPGRHPGQWKVPQARTEELLHDWATELGAVVLRGHELRALEVTADHVLAEVAGPAGPMALRAKYVVGCDGEDSTVRRLGGFDFPGTDASRELLRADVAGIDIPDRRFERLERGLAIAARRPDGVTRIMVHEFDRPRRTTGEPGFDDVVQAWRRVTDEDISGGTPLWVNAFGDASRQAARYRDVRLFLAGDAAHQQMPIGGQALNLGLQDAVNLGWKLAAQVRGRGPEGLLDSYHTERHAVGSRTLGNIRAQALLLLGPTETGPVREVVGELLARDGVREHLAGMISGLDVRYDVGPGSHPLLGARLPYARLLHGGEGGGEPAGEAREMTTPELLRTGRGLLLDLSGDPAPADRTRAAAGPWSGLVDTVIATHRGAGADATPDGALSGTDAVLVRPDGHVAWTGSEGEPDLVTALGRWFGAPAAPHNVMTSKKRRYDMGRLNGRTALVTGASRGIGRATAVRLAQEGALVAVHYASGQEDAEETVASIEKDGGRAFAVQAELGVPGDVHRLFVALENGLKERTGSTELNILVNNAGVMGGTAAEDTTPEQFDRLMAVNAKAPFFIVQRALQNIPSGGRIVNISSGLTRFANPQEIAYAMTKGAVEMLALHYAKALGPRNITVNSVAPGITRNGNPAFGIPEAVEQMAAMSTFNRVGEPQDIADVVAFLATDDARWITGAFIDATGGTLLG